MPKKIWFIVLSLILSSIALADSTPPTTLLTKNPSTPNGNNNWYKNSVNLTLNATDLESGVKSIYYKVNSETWTHKDFLNTLNLAPDASFENLENAWQITPPEDSLVATQDYTVFKFGSVSEKLISDDSNWSNSNWHGINNFNKFSVVEPYSTVNFSAWLKTENLSKEAYFKIYSVSMDTNKNLTAKLLDQSSKLYNTSDWTKISKTITLNDPNTLGVFMEIGMEGSGVVWVDAVNISKSSTDAQVEIFLGNDGINTLQYYSVDQEGNTESQRSETIKIDQTPPENWKQIVVTNQIGDPEYMVTVQTNVEDKTSGLSDGSRYYQYKTEAEYGIYSDATDCNSTWQTGGWATLQYYPTPDGTNLATLKTSKINFCDSNWGKCKAVRFKASDLAGNEITKDYCINGPWISSSGGGKVGSNSGISMSSQTSGFNTDGVIETKNSMIDFFSTSNGYKAKNTSVNGLKSYTEFWNSTKSKNLISNLNSSSGVFYTNGDLEINSWTNELKNSDYVKIIFINGNLSINTNVEISKTTGLVFIVKGDVKVSKNVQSVQAAIITDKSIYTAYDLTNLETTNNVEFKGVFSADKFVFQRKLSINNSPSESFVYEPKYLIKLKPYLAKSQVEYVK